MDDEIRLRGEALRGLKIMFIVAGLLTVTLTCSGCALLSIPGQLISGLFNLVGQGVSAASSVPTPPPWVFF